MELIHIIAETFQKSFRFVTAHILVPLLIGACLYVFFRGIPRLQLQSYFNIQSYFIGAQFILYSLPDGLWLYALLSAMHLIWASEQRNKMIWVLCICSATLSTEVLQNRQLLPGVFDWLDLLAYFLAMILFFNINKIQFIKNNT